MGDCCDMHRNVMALFPHVQCAAARSSGGVLYRTMEYQGAAVLYLMSESQPDLSNADWLESSCTRIRDLEPLRSILTPGKSLCYDLLAHPSKKVDADRKNSARIFLRTEDERRQWLTRQGVKNGFRIVTMQEKQSFDLHGKRSTGAMFLKAVQFAGVLQVTEANLFWNGYIHGIGAEKSYGMGMLLLSGL